MVLAGAAVYGHVAVVGGGGGAVYGFAGAVAFDFVVVADVVADVVVDCKDGTSSSSSRWIGVEWVVIEDVGVKVKVGYFIAVHDSCHSVGKNEVCSMEGEGIRIVFGGGVPPLLSRKSTSFRLYAHPIDFRRLYKVLSAITLFTYTS
eukprot:m.102208 g.102208  ORF g.102208 m.102208 type:complete len:147 (+) comp9074_c1_seq8:1214-1654(+)